MKRKMRKIIIYKEKKSNFADETERIIKAAAKLIKNEINIFGGHY